ncbi:cytochrome P460 family protein [Falsiroseomonas sp.]|uniref:cytochrome P460 family protein n=1 Tax=Falsiroseomonas sp. TaxID=2870721 RepID=UPI003F71BBC5
MRVSMLAGAVALTLSPLGLLAVGAAAQPRAPYTPGPHNIELPADWQSRFIRYATVDKADRKIIRHMYVNPEAYAATRAGQPAPMGTLLIMADTRARLDAQGNPLLDTSGRFIPEPGWIALGVQQKEAGWGEGYGPDQRNGNWEYAAFDGAGARRNVSMNSCFGCHLGARAQQDFTFTYWDHAVARR